MIRFAVHTELRMSSTWTDITEDVYTRDDIEIERGRPDETSDVDHGKCTLTLNNRHGRYTPRDPRGVYYGRIGRNTPLRVWVGETPPSGAAETVADDDDSQDAPAVDSRADEALLLCGWISIPDPGSYNVPDSMDEDAETVGTNSTMVTATEELDEPGDTGTRTATITADDIQAYATFSVATPGTDGPPEIEEAWADTSSETITFRTGPDTTTNHYLVAVHVWNADFPNTSLMPGVPGGTPGTWTILADSLRVSGDRPHVRVWGRRVDVDGPQEVEFARQKNVTQFDNHARLYVLSGVPESSVRFVGEVTSWPQRWDESDTDVHVPIEAAGILRRLGQGAAPLRSAMRREVLAEGREPPVTYWPCEDGRDATRVASGLPDGEPMEIRGEPDMASFRDFSASDSLPQMREGRFIGAVPDYTPSGQTQVRWLLAIPEDGADDGQPVIVFYVSGTATRWVIRYHNAGTGWLSFAMFNASGQELHNSGPITFDTHGKLLHCAMEMGENDDGDVDWNFKTREVGGGTSIWSDTLTSHTVGRVRDIRVAPGTEDGNLGDTAIGHVSVHNEITSIWDLGDALSGWDGERAADRLERLCREEGIIFNTIGDLGDTERMGPQGVETLVDLLRECGEADGGILRETREHVGLTYRTRMSLYNQGL